MILFDQAPHLTIITGHYGVGKTNLSLNIVRDLRSVIPRVTLIDLDIVNPYFRSTDSLDFLDSIDVSVLGPFYARSTLDTPSLSPGIDEAIISADSAHAVVVDVGGDPDGARALGRYRKNIAKSPHRLVFVVNMSRPETSSIDENVALLKAIEETSGLKVTHIIGNTHLKEFSTAEDIAAAIPATLEVARRAGAEFVAATAPRNLAKDVVDVLAKAADSAKLGAVNIYPVDKIVATPWEHCGIETAKR